MIDFVAAECGIRQLYAHFADAVWRKDGTAFADCFSEHGEWKIATMHMRGQAEIGETFDLLLGACDRVQVMTGTPVLEVGDRDATGRVQVTELAKMKDGTSAMTLGVYYDHYVQEADRWRFRWRHFGLHYRGPIDLSAELVDCPDYGPPPGLPGADEPTYTRRSG